MPILDFKKLAEECAKAAQRQGHERGYGNAGRRDEAFRSDTHVTAQAAPATAGAAKPDLQRRMARAADDPRLAGFDELYRFFSESLDPDGTRIMLGEKPTDEMFLGLSWDSGFVKLHGRFDKSLKLLGSICKTGRFRPSIKLHELPIQLRGYVWRELQPFKEDPLEAVKTYGFLTGQCCMCGKLLTDPPSVASKVGPVCAERIGMRCTLDGLQPLSEHQREEVRRRARQASVAPMDLNAIIELATAKPSSESDRDSDSEE